MATVKKDNKLMALLSVWGILLVLLGHSGFEEPEIQQKLGWLTGATALAKTEDCDGPDLIYLPEVPFDVDKFLVKVKELLTKKSSVVIAVSEGIKLADGRYVCELGSVGDYVDAFGHKRIRTRTE